jgi:hypothetical protein
MPKRKRFPKNVSLLKVFCGGISSFLLKDSRYISLICKEVFFLKVILSTFYEVSSEKVQHQNLVL